MKSLIEDYGKAKRIVLLDKLFRLDDEPFFYNAGLVYLGNCFVA